MPTPQRGYAAFTAFWLFLCFALPEWRLGPLPLRVAEAFGLGLAAWALLAYKIPRPALWAAGLWCLALGLAAARGLQLGNPKADIVAELRNAYLAPALLALAALQAPWRRLAAIAAAGGAGIFALCSLLVFFLEPTGFSNPNVTPVPVPSLDHAMHQWWILGALGLGLPLLKGRYFALCILLWALAWLTFLRGLWVAWAFGACAGTALLCVSSGWKEALAYLGRQAGAALLALALVYGLLLLAHPDGAFLLKFRVQRTLQAARLLKPLPDKIQAPAACSALLRQTASRGGLFMTLAREKGAPTASEANRSDLSLMDRALMRRMALDAFKASPLLGAGLGSQYRQELFPGHVRFQRDPHNGYAWVLAKSGLAGMLALAALAFLALAQAAQAPVPAQARAALVVILFYWLALEWLQAGLVHSGTATALALLFGVLARGREKA